jgi:hypothetical protein
MTKLWNEDVPARGPNSFAREMKNKLREIYSFVCIVLQSLGQNADVSLRIKNSNGVKNLDKRCEGETRLIEANECSLASS